MQVTQVVAVHVFGADGANCFYAGSSMQVKVWFPIDSYHNYVFVGGSCDSTTQIPKLFDVGDLAL